MTCQVSTVTKLVPVAKRSAAEVITTVFALDQAINFNAPCARVKVEAEAAAPLASATAESVLANPAGAAWTELAETAPAMIAVVDTTPRFAKNVRSFSN